MLLVALGWHPELTVFGIKIDPVFPGTSVQQAGFEIQQCLRVHRCEGQGSNFPDMRRAHSR
jgi:hypothetical protein